jgi:hypothetical protein
MSRISELEARRLALLARCEAQRAELAQRVEQLRGGPGNWLPAGTHGLSGFIAALRRSRHPLAWVTALSGILVLGRARDVLSAILWARSAVSAVARVAETIGLAGALRRRRART